MAERFRQQFQRKLDEARRVVLRGLQKGGRAFVREMQVRRMSGPTSSESLSVRTGAGRRSVNAEVSVVPSGAELRGTVGRGVPYLAVHEFGGVIRPKRTKALAVPLQAAKTAAGVARGGPRDFPDLKFVPAKVGNLVGLLVKYVGRGKNRKSVPYFALVKEITLPARLGFRKTFRAQARETLRDIRRELQKLRKGRVR